MSSKPFWGSLRFANLRDVSWLMNNKSIPKRTIERKEREAEALKANLKKRKKQPAIQSASQKSLKENENDGQH